MRRDIVNVNYVERTMVLASSHLYLLNPGLGDWKRLPILRNQRQECNEQ